MAYLCFAPELAADTLLWICAGGQPATDLGAHPPEVSGVGTQTTDGGAHPPRHFVSVRPDSQAAYQGMRPSVVSVVGAQSTHMGVRQPGFRCVVGLLILFHSPGAEAGGVSEAVAVDESSLTSCRVPLFFPFFFSRKETKEMPTDKKRRRGRREWHSH